MRPASAWTEEIYEFRGNRTYTEWYRFIANIQEDAFLAGVKHERESLRFAAEQIEGDDIAARIVRDAIRALAERPMPPLGFAR